jgi:quercetin dioxygenase-like cupin family protein
MPGKFMFQTEANPAVLDWGRFSWLSDPSKGAKQLTVIDTIISPGKGLNFHLHPDQEEVMYVISGTIEQWIDREKQILGPGDSAFVPAGVVHTSVNVGTDEAKVLTILGLSMGHKGIELVDVSCVTPWNGLRPNAP